MSAILNLLNKIENWALLQMGLHNVYIHQKFDYNRSSIFLNMNYFVKTIKMHTDRKIKFLKGMNTCFRLSLGPGTIL